MMGNKLTYAYCLAFIAIGLGMLLRFDQLSHIPPGYTFDEASHALDAQDILHGQGSLLSSRLEQTAMGYMYLLAAAYAVWGDAPLVSRALTAAFGTWLIPLNFWAIRHLFLPSLGQTKATWLASWSSLLIASSFWATITSRLGYEYILTPVAQLAALTLFWLGYQGKSWGKIALAACFNAASYYLYDGAMSFLLVIPISTVGYALLQRQNNAQAWLKVLFFSGLSVCLVAPLLWASFGGDTPAMARTERKLIFNQVTTLNEGLTLLGRGAWVHTQPFLALEGSSRWLMNLSRRPILDPFLAASWVVGLGLCFWRIKQWPYLTMLIYWVGMLAPNVLTYEGSPRYFRMIGMLPATYFFVALAWVEGQHWLQQHRPRLAPLTVWVLLGWGLVWLPGRTYYDYFQVWAQHPRVAPEHDVEVIELVQRMKQETNPQALFLLPRLATNPRPNFVIDYLYQGQAGFRYLIVDGPATRLHLTEAVTGYQTVYYISHLQGARERHHYSPDYAMVPWLLQQQGQHLKTETTPAYTLEVYQLNSLQTDFRRTVRTELPAHFQPLSLTLVDPVKVVGWDYQPTRQAITMTLAWQGITQLPIDFTVFIQLTDWQGQIAGKIDVGIARGVKSDTTAEILLVPYTISGSYSTGSYTPTVGLYYFEADQRPKAIGAVVLPPVVIP